MAAKETKPMNYTPVIGLEVHIELKTKSKMFCRCSTDYFGKKPNSYVCPICLGLPGALPVPNLKAIEWCILIGLALNCEIPLFSKFDRKNYFYPDLPKGYQISQYDMPFCINGHMVLSSGKKIKIRRVHMEEDTGKLIHQVVDGEKATLIDFNRSGVPLVEIVTEPDFENAEEVKEYLKKLQQIARYLKVSDSNMEKGEMRLEPNISLKDKIFPSYKVEVKNINSFKFVGKAIDFEIKRQSEMLDKGETPRQETRGFVEKSSSTVTQRIKEEASDYRYFPEPDIPPFCWQQGYIDLLKKEVSTIMHKPSEEEQRKEKILIKFSPISPMSAATIAKDSKFYDSYGGTASIGKDEFGTTYQGTANAIINQKVPLVGISDKERAKLIADLNKVTEVDKDVLNNAIEEVIRDNKEAISDYKKGKETAIMFLLGQVMRRIGSNANADKIKASLLAKIK